MYRSAVDGVRYYLRLAEEPGQDMTTDALLPGRLFPGPRLPDDHLRAIRASAILLGLRQLSLWLSPGRAYPLSHRLVQLRITELSNLLKGKPAHPQR